MPANMTRLAQVCGMSTRESLNRPRRGVTAQFQSMELADLRLNKAQTAGYEGHASTVTVHRAITGHKETKYGTEKIFSKEADIKWLLWQCVKADPTWKPAAHCSKAIKEHPILKGRNPKDCRKGHATAHGMLSK